MGEKVTNSLKKKILPVVVLLAIGVLVWFLLPGGKGADSGGIRTAGIVEGTEVNINSKIAGRIGMLCGREGYQVSKNEVVMRLDNADLQAQVRLAEAGLAKAHAEVEVAVSGIVNLRAQVNTAKADVRAAEANLCKAAVQVKDADRHLKQMHNLYKDNTVAKEKLDSALTGQEAALAGENSAQAMLASSKTRVKAALAQLVMAGSQIKAAKTGVQGAEASLAYQKARLDDTVIRSPIAGTVVYLALEQGETISPGMTAMTIVDLKRLTVRVDIDESMIDRLQVGRPALIYPAGDVGRTVKGMVSAINRYADFATQKDVTGSRQDIKTFRVTIAVGDGGGFLSPGMTVIAAIPNSSATTNAYR